MILYLLKFSISTVVLFGFYHFWLAREKTLVFNRFYLLLSLIFSLTIPFLQFEFYNAPALEIPTAAFDANSTSDLYLPVVEQDNAISLAHDFSLFSVLAGLYIIITILLGIRFFVNLMRLVIRIYTHEKASLADGKLVLMEAPCLPHSFFQYIFVHKEAFEKGAIDPDIIKHEASHGKQWHSIDVLFIELVQVFFWFNPIVFLYKKAIKLNHEYLADAEVLAGGTNLYNYQKVLLQLISEQSSSTLACNFNYSSTKKRLLMMTAEKNLRKSTFKVLFLIPVLITMVTIFACSQIEEVAPDQGVFSRESVKMLQLNKTSVSEFEEKFGQPDQIEARFHPDFNAELEWWTYKQKGYHFQAVFNRNLNILISYFFGMQMPDSERELEPEAVKNLRGKNVQDIKNMYGTPNELSMAPGHENWTYRSPISRLRIIINTETEKVGEYSYSYESSDQ